MGMKFQTNILSGTLGLTLWMLRQPRIQSKLIQPPQPRTSNCFLPPIGGPGHSEGCPVGGPEGAPDGGPEGGSVSSHFGALVLVRSVPPTQEYISQRAISPSSDPGHSSSPKKSRLASIWQVSLFWQAFFTKSNWSSLPFPALVQLYKTFRGEYDLRKHES